MKKRYRIPPALVEKYKDELCFMVETYFTCMEVVVPWVKVIETMGYEMSLDLIEGYAHIFLHYKIESIGDFEIQKELENMRNNDLSLKFERKYLEHLNLVKNMFYIDFDNNEWTRIILSRMHDYFLWL